MNPHNIQTPQIPQTYQPSAPRPTNLGQMTAESLLLAAGDRALILNVRDLGAQVQGQVTVMLSRFGPVAAGSPNTSDVRARIQFGAGGASQIVECDWANGLQLSVGATAIQVEAVGVPIIGDEPYDPLPTRVGVTLTQYPRGGTLPPKHTTPALLAPAGLVDIVAPAFASQVRVLAANATGGSGYGGDLLLRQYAGTVLLYERAITNPDPVAILSTRPCVVRVSNGSGVASYHLHVQFDLNL